MIKRLGENDYKTFWRKFHGSPLQSWSWGELKKDTWDVERIGVLRNKTIVAVIAVMYRKFPLRALTRIFGFETFAYIPRGFASNSDIGYAMNELSNYLKRKKVAFSLIDPENNFEVDKWNEKFEKELKKNDWKEAGVTIQPNQTDLIRIDYGEDEMYKRLRPKWRRNIRKAERQGVKIKEVKDISGVNDFYTIISDVKDRTSFKLHSLEYFQKMWSEMSKENIIKIFHATYKNKKVASYLILTNDYLAAEVFGGATKLGRDTEASYLLKWETMKSFAREGMKYYDQWGVAPKDAKEHPLKGISYFKSGFGGKYREFLPQYVNVYNPVGYSCYKFIQKLR